MNKLFIQREEGVEYPYSTVATRDAVLVNKQYCDEIEQEMVALAEPKIRDAIEAQRRKGNRPYFEYDWRGDGRPPYLYEDGIQETFDLVPPEHELTHLVARVAHTPQQEMFGLAVELGITYGVNLARWPRLADPKWAEVRRQRIAEYRKRATLYYQSDPPNIASSRDWAIYYAVGMYIREKMEQFAAADMLDKPYATQNSFVIHIRSKISSLHPLSA